MAITTDQIKFIMANWDKMTCNAIAHDQKISSTTVERIRKQRGLTLTKQQSYNLRDYGKLDVTPEERRLNYNKSKREWAKRTRAKRNELK